MGRDINDLAMEGGADAILLAVANGRRVPKISERNSVPTSVAQLESVDGAGGHHEPPYVVRRASDVLSTKPMRWRVHGVLPESGLAAFYGPSGGGKSFLLLDICIAIAEGAGHWFGRRVKAAPVAYVCLEGEGGISKRLKAWSIHNGRALPDALHVVMSQPVDLRSLSDVQRLCEALILAGVQDGVVAIDTLAQATPGFDENSGQDMSEVLTASKAIQATLGGLVILVHHTGKTDGKGLRGHSSLLAALDSSIEVCRNGVERNWSVAKSKDDADGESCEFQLDRIELDDDEDGNPVTSCVINPSAAPPNWAPEKPKGDEQILVFEAIGKLLLGSKVFGKDPSHPSRPGVFLEEAVEAASNVLTCEVNRRKNRARRAIQRMIAREIYAFDGEFIWLR
ncbi:AAA family ATPase [Caballeronia insecticola]|nr:AAA family ATPase [Caballeronia insecticola]